MNIDAKFEKMKIINKTIKHRSGLIQYISEILNDILRYFLYSISVFGVRIEYSFQCKNCCPLALQAVHDFFLFVNAVP